MLKIVEGKKCHCETQLSSQEMSNHMNLGLEMVLGAKARDAMRGYGIITQGK